MKAVNFIVFIIGFIVISIQADARISLVKYNRVYHGLAFNMSTEAFSGVCKARIKAKFMEKIAATSDAAERDRLTRAMNKSIKAVDSWTVRFTKNNKSWDASVLSGEFMKGRGEVMTSRPMKNTRRYFFFHNDKLVKIIEIETKALSSYMFKFSSLYGKPLQVKYAGNQTRKPSEIIWEDNDIRFSIKSIGDPFNCVMLRWALKAEDNEWEALRAKTLKKKKSLDSLVRDAQSATPDKSVDKKMEELLGPDDNKKGEPKSSLQPLLP